YTSGERRQPGDDDSGASFVPASWRSYFGFCETPYVLIQLTRWVRLRLRAAMWRQWKTPRRRRAALLELGVRPRLANNTAGSGLGPWYLARAKALSVGLSNAYFQSLGLPTLIDGCSRNQLEPPCTDPYARWCGRGRWVTAAPMPIKSACRVISAFGIDSGRITGYPEVIPR